MQKLVGGCQLDSSVGNAHARNLRDINKFQQNKKKTTSKKNQCRMDVSRYLLTITLYGKNNYSQTSVSQTILSYCSIQSSLQFMLTDSMV